MTIPAHDSVAYLPARPRLALLRKEADQLNLCLHWDLCFDAYLGPASREARGELEPPSYPSPARRKVI